MSRVVFGVVAGAVGATTMAMLLGARFARTSWIRAASTYAPTPPPKKVASSSSPSSPFFIRSHRLMLAPIQVKIALCQLLTSADKIQNIEVMVSAVRVSSMSQSWNVMPIFIHATLSHSLNGGH